MENLQVQRKKMSLANIEGRLTLEEMENVMAGSGGRKCFLMGGLTMISGFLGPVAFMAAAIYTTAECA